MSASAYRLEGDAQVPFCAPVLALRILPGFGAARVGLLHVRRQETLRYQRIG